MSRVPVFTAAADLRSYFSHERPALPATAVNDFISAAERTRAPAAFANDVFNLSERAGLTDEALSVLAGRARHGGVQPHWLADSALSDDLLDFLARDPRAPLNALQRRGANDPSRWTEDFLQGLAGEYLFQRDLHRRLPGYEIQGRQVRLGRTEADFVVAPQSQPRAIQGVEVKAWSGSRWQKALSAEARLDRREPFRAAHTSALAQLHRLLDQLQASAEATGRPPLLVTLDGLGPTLSARLDAVLNDSFPASQRPVRMTLSAKEVKAMKDELREDLRVAL